MNAPPFPPGPGDQQVQDPDPPDTAQALVVAIRLLRDLRQHLEHDSPPSDRDELAGRAAAVRRVLVRVLAEVSP